MRMTIIYVYKKHTKNAHILVNVSPMVQLFLEFYFQ